jgi:hypothetical protein
LAGVINQYLSLVFFYEQFWFDKGTTIKEIHTDIVSGDNYNSFEDGVRYVPIGNIIFSATWFFGELILTVLLAMFGNPSFS